MIPVELDRILRDLDPRVVPLAFVLILVIGVLAGLQLGIKPAYAHYNALRAEHALARASFAAEAAGGAASIAMLEDEVGRLRRELYGDSATVPREQIESFVVNTLDRISSRHGVDLLAITPDEASSVLMFDELPYAVEVAGSYFAVHRWLYEVEDELRPMVVKQFELLPGRDGERVLLSLRIVAYRAPDEEGGS